MTEAALVAAKDELHGDLDIRVNVPGRQQDIKHHQGPDQLCRLPKCHFEFNEKEGNSKTATNFVRY